MKLHPHQSWCWLCLLFGNAPGLWSQKAATLCALRAAAAAGHILLSGLYNSDPSDPSLPPRLLPLVLQDAHPQVQQKHNRPKCDRTSDSWRVFFLYVPKSTSRLGVTCTFTPWLQSPCKTKRFFLHKCDTVVKHSVNGHTTKSDLSEKNLNWALRTVTGT